MTTRRNRRLRFETIIAKFTISQLALKESGRWGLIRANRMTGAESAGDA
jgi:hypothetical protein